MKNEELRTKTTSELNDLIVQHKKEALNLRFQRVNGQLESVARVRQVRRTVARIKTILTEKTKSKK